MFQQGSTVNFAGMVGDHLFKIENGILTNISINHDYHRLCGYPELKGVQVLTLTKSTVNLEILLNNDGMCISDEGYDLNNIRNKFVSQCTIEELLVAIQAKMNNQ